ncbi:hypothetical protein [Gramella sp. KN1008]|uniref:hypothetical protein n=1 Tax=Gramella sp. KN1008 TaxID=2529298 RepID=UPI0013F1479A|nr:hypothetical protein [Gramella sp. KN1008]
MRNLLVAFFSFGIIFISSAQSLDQYKYILIPKTYEFTGDVDQYRLNSLTKFLFEKEGFNTYMKIGEKPEDLRKDPCLALDTKVENNSGLFVTKLVLILEDCYGNEVFRSEEGRSREKEYEVAYKEALRDAFKSIKELDYAYQPSAIDKGESISAKLSLPGKIEVDEEEMEEEEVEEVIEEIAEKELEEAEEEEGELSDLQIEGTKKYLYAGKTYSLKETSEGYGLYPENTSEPIAILIETEGGKSFIYNSLTNQGIAYFDADNNLIVEYFSRQENKKVMLKYELENQ